MCGFIFGDLLLIEVEFCEEFDVLCFLVCEVICMFFIFDIVDVWYGYGIYVGLMLLDLMVEVFVFCGVFFFEGLL